MTCPSCKKRDATIHITQNVNGKTTRIDLCPLCAKEQGYLGESGDLASGLLGGEPFGTAGMNLFQMAGGMSGSAGSPFSGERCAYCGTSFEEFRSKGLLGCCHCYDEFGQRLLPVIRRIQAGEIHTGRRPAGRPEPPPEVSKPERRSILKRPIRVPKKKMEEQTGTTPAKTGAEQSSEPPAAPPETELARLRREQAEAVKAEDYEKAARIRDRIRAIESGKEGGAPA